VVGRSYSLVCSFQLCYPPTLGRAVASAEALGRLDPLIDLLAGDHREDVIDDDVKQFATHALASSESGERRSRAW
jgi:hypothetical protein